MLRLLWRRAGKDAIPIRNPVKPETHGFYDVVVQVNQDHPFRNDLLYVTPHLIRVQRDQISWKDKDKRREDLVFAAEHRPRRSASRHDKSRSLWQLTNPKILPFPSALLHV